MNLRATVGPLRRYYIGSYEENKTNRDLAEAAVLQNRRNGHLVALTKETVGTILEKERRVDVLLGCRPVLTLRR